MMKDSEKYYGETEIRRETGISRKTIRSVLHRLSRKLIFNGEEWEDSEGWQDALLESKWPYCGKYRLNLDSHLTKTLLSFKHESLINTIWVYDEDHDLMIFRHRTQKHSHVEYATKPHIRCPNCSYEW